LLGTALAGAGSGRASWACQSAPCHSLDARERLGCGGPVPARRYCRAAARRPGGLQCGPYLLFATDYAGLRCLRPALPHAPAAGGESQRVGAGSKGGAFA